METHLSHFNSWLHYRRACQIILTFSTVFLFVAMLPATALAAGNDFIATTLRVDLASVNSAKDYIHTIYTGGLPNNGGTGDFTTAWLGAYLTPSGTFTQVGFMTDRNGPTWFVYSEAGVECLQGHPVYGNLGCQGNYYDRATIGNWQSVELVTYNQGFWIARVYDQYGVALDVAKILYNDSTNAIYGAFAYTEEGYTESTDPYMLASFYHSHPQYFIGGTGYPFTDWPASSGGNNNVIYATPASICPGHYSAKLKINGDPRIWYAGSTINGKATCLAQIF